jgi:hypothetical protein
MVVTKLGFQLFFQTCVSGILSTWPWGPDNNDRMASQNSD